MVEKYREIIIYEVENGWILKFIPAENLKELDRPSFTSTYHKDVDSLNKKIKELCK